MSHQVECVVSAKMVSKGNRPLSVYARHNAFYAPTCTFSLAGEQGHGNNNQYVSWSRLLKSDSSVRLGKLINQKETLFVNEYGQWCFELGKRHTFKAV